MPSRTSPRWRPTATTPEPGDGGGGGDPALEARVDALEIDLDAAELDVAALEANFPVTNASLADMATARIKGRTTSGTGDPEDLTAAQTKALLAIGAADVSGLATVATSGSASDLGTGTLPAGRLPALTGDATSSAGSAATTIANNAVSNAKLADMATATIKGRTTGGTGDPEDLTVTQATAMLNAATATVKGMVPTPPNNTTTFLRGDATFVAPKQRLFLFYGGAVMTAGDLDRFPNPVGFSTSPIGATGNGYHSPVSGSLIATHYRVITAHTTNTVTVIPRVNGVQQTTQTQTIAATVTNQSTTHATPLAVTAGEFIACQMDHNGATNLAGLTVIFEIEF